MVGQKCCISRGARLNSRNIQTKGVQRGGDNVVSRRSRGAAPKVRVAKGSEFGEGEY